MRTLRFRAWDKRYKFMFNVLSVNWKSAGEISIIRGIHKNEVCLVPSQDFVLMQYTGLKDKNGKEIYEGDICRCIHSEQNGNNPFKKIEQVYTRPGGFSLFGKPMQDFSYESNNRLTAFNWKTDRSINISEYYYKIYDIEVIGNIYENPDLIK